jgi:hypothetical protein
LGGGIKKIPSMVTVGVFNPGPKLIPLISTNVSPNVLPTFGVILDTLGAEELNIILNKIYSHIY